MKGIVYCYYDKETDTPLYVGYTTRRMKDRHKSHIQYGRRSLIGKETKPVIGMVEFDRLLYVAPEKYYYKVLASFDDISKPELFEIEKQKTCELNPVYNIAIGTEHSESMRKKESEARKGVPKTEEWKRKIGLARVGKKRAPFSEEWKRNLSKHCIGRIWINNGKENKFILKEEIGLYPDYSRGMLPQERRVI